MNRQKLQELMREVAAGTVGVDEAVNRLAALPFRDLGFAKVDTHRSLRTGHPEVVYGQGKTPEQLVKIVGELAGGGQPVLATRLSAEATGALCRSFPDGRVDEAARAFVLGSTPSPQGHVAVLCAGTSDVPVAAEAALTAAALGSEVGRHWDVGVAGLHRLLAVGDELAVARVVVVVAGMEGALPSVVGGLVPVPVVAVPTSVGYGASFGGLAALLGMLNSCAPGVAVVNIDNGFGAGYLAHLINVGAANVPESGGAEASEGSDTATTEGGGGGAAPRSRP